MLFLLLELEGLISGDSGWEVRRAKFSVLYSCSKGKFQAWKALLLQVPWFRFRLYYRHNFHKRIGRHIGPHTEEICVWMLLWSADNCLS